MYFLYFSSIPSSQLNGTAQLTAAVQLISLKRGRVRRGSPCLTAGWGDIGDNRTEPNTLQEVNVTTLSRRTCRRRWGSVPIARSMVCGVGERVFQGFCSVRQVNRLDIDQAKLNTGKKSIFKHTYCWVTCIFSLQGGFRWPSGVWWSCSGRGLLLWPAMRKPQDPWCLHKSILLQGLD